MYAFVDHNSHDYITDNHRTQRAPEIDWVAFAPGSGPAPRPVLPTGFADESLLSFSHGELSEGWEAAQTAQLIGATFMERFDCNLPDYPGIAHQAHEWLVNITDAFHGDESKADEFRVARQLLQGVIDAARRGAQGQPTRWSPWRRGLNLDVHSPSGSGEQAPRGAWYQARGADGSDWRARKAGDEVEAVRMSDGSSRMLTPGQARRVLTLLGKVA
jgi:hypothetical protein